MAISGSFDHPYNTPGSTIAYGWVTATTDRDNPSSFIMSGMSSRRLSLGPFEPPPYVIRNPGLGEHGFIFTGGEVEAQQAVYAAISSWNQANSSQHAGKTPSSS